MARSTKKDVREETEITKFLKKYFGWGDLIALILIIIYFTTIHPYALISYQAGCEILTPQQVDEKGYEQQGYTQTFYNNETNKTDVKIELFTKDLTVSKHEQIHVMQFRQGRTFSCRFPLGRYLNEAEAYIMQNLPSGVLNFVYGTDAF